MKVFPLIGNSQRLDGGAMFGNAPKAMWQKLAAADDENRILLMCRSLLVQIDGKNVLFEAGIGNFFEPKLKERYGVVEEENLLIESLNQIGIGESDIDAVVLSHLHFDHAGGLLSRFDQEFPQHLLFPAAKIYVSREHFERAKNPHARDRASFVPALNGLIENSGRLVLVEKNGAHDLGSWLKFRFSSGHTPGLMLAEINNGQRKGIYASDLIPGMAWVSASLSMGYDRFAELVLDEKKQLLDELCDTEDVLFFTHDPEFACAKVMKDQNGRFYASQCAMSDWNT